MSEETKAVLRGINRMMMKFCVKCLVPAIVLSLCWCPPVNAGDASADKEKPMEAIARAAVGKVLSFVLETPTTVERVRLNGDDQVLELEGLKITNPKGFEAEHVVAVDAVQVKADPKALFSAEPLVNLISVSGAQVNAEVNPRRGINLKKLMDSATRFGQPKLFKPPKKKWRIEKAIMEECAVDITTELLNRQTKHKSLDRYEMSLMGEDGKGMTADKAVVKVLEVLMDKIGPLEGSPLESVSPLLETIKKF